MPNADRVPDAAIPRQRGDARVFFLAHLADVRGMVSGGWPLTAVYEEVGAHRSMRYPQFVKYVNRYLADDRFPPLRPRTRARSGQPRTAQGAPLPP